MGFHCFGERNGVSTAMNLVPQEYCGLISEYNLLPTS